MSDTPRTDAAWKAAFRSTSIDAESIRDFTQILERENAAMREVIRVACERLAGLEDHLSGNHGLFLLDALSKLQPFLAMNGDQQCAWKEDEDGNWDTSCGQCMAFEWAPPKEQGYKFCHHCGKPIKFIERRESKTEDEEL